ncbi:MAG TPA: hypothetical protein VKU37_02180, partial [Verrucomicrobiae bacterium]|nr:hypothetical protein [Verrucomicrobiae bacterium]
PAAAPVATDVTPYLGRGAGGSLQSVVCPLDPKKAFASSYTIGDMSTTPVCQIQPTGDASGNYVHKLPQ